MATEEEMPLPRPGKPLWASWENVLRFVETKVERLGEATTMNPFEFNVLSEEKSSGGTIMVWPVPSCCSRNLALQKGLPNCWHLNRYEALPAQFSSILLLLVLTCSSLHRMNSFGALLKWAVLVCVCVRAGLRRVCPGRRVRCPVLQMSVAAASPVDPPRPPNSECRDHSISMKHHLCWSQLPFQTVCAPPLCDLTLLPFWCVSIHTLPLPPFLFVPLAMNRSRVLCLAGRTSGGRCLSRRAPPATPAANRSRTPRSVPPHTPVPPPTDAPDPEPDASRSARNSNYRLVSLIDLQPSPNSSVLSCS